MNVENMTMVRLNESRYASEAQDDSGNAIYCEIRYKRDRSSFAGMAFKLKENNNVTVRECEKKVIQEISKYEKLYLGCELDYINSIQQIFLKKERKYGIEILFLVYSDVRSSQIIYEELMKAIEEEIDKITLI